MRTHGYYTTPTPRTPLQERPVLFALLFALLAIILIGVVMMIAWATARPAAEEIAPASALGVSAETWQEYRQGEQSAAPVVPASAVGDEAAWREYRQGEQSAAPPAVSDEAAWREYRQGEQSAAPPTPAPAVRDEAAWEEYRLGERALVTQEP